MATASVPLNMRPGHEQVEGLLHADEPRQEPADVGVGDDAAAGEDEAELGVLGHHPEVEEHRHGEPGARRRRR